MKGASTLESSSCWSPRCCWTGIQLFSCRRTGLPSCRRQRVYQQQALQFSAMQQRCPGGSSCGWGGWREAVRTQKALRLRQNPESHISTSCLQGTMKQDTIHLSQRVSQNSLPQINVSAYQVHPQQKKQKRTRVQEHLKDQ